MLDAFRLKTNKEPSSERKVSRLVRDGRSLRAVEITQFLRKVYKIHSCALSSTRLRREPPLGGSLSYAVQTLCVRALSAEITTNLKPQVSKFLKDGVKNTRYSIMKSGA